MGGSAKGPSPVEVIRHKDTRLNIPTHELRDFVKDDEGLGGCMVEDIRALHHLDHEGALAQRQLILRADTGEYPVAQPDPA